MAVVFRFERRNRYSLMALAASMERFPELAAVPLFKAVPLKSRRLGSRMRLPAELAAGFETIVLCYSIMTPQWSDVVQEIRDLSTWEHRHKLLLVAGGPHPTGTPRTTLAAGFDVVCAGEGEEAFPRILLAHAAGAGMDDIPGLYRWRGSEMVFTGPGERPAWEELNVLAGRNMKFGPLEISRGCPYPCRYCQTPVLQGKGMRHKRVDLIWEAVDHLVEANRVDIRFIAPNALAYGSEDGFHLNLPAVSTMLEGVARRLPSHGRIFFGSFPSEVRPESITNESVDIIRAFGSNREVVLGAQSGNVAMLTRMRRGHGPGEVRRACQLLLKKGMRPVVDFILGLPMETPGQMRDTVDFMEELSSDGARAHAHTFLPLPGSPWAAFRATPLPLEIRRRLEDLISRGRLFGQWKGQEKTSQRLSDRKP